MTFRMPSRKQRRLLVKALREYQSNVNLAAGFLTGRGIGKQVAHKWGLGVAVSPAPSHELLAGRLVIPYVNKAEDSPVTGLTGRCLHDHDCDTEGHRKYMQLPNQPTFLFNAAALDDQRASTVHVCEGELDAILLSEVLSDPVVAVSGVDKWEPHWVAHFRGWERVVVWPDGDKAGKQMASLWSRKIMCDVVSMPAGQDVTSLYLTEGIEALRELAGGNDDD